MRCDVARDKSPPRLLAQPSERSPWREYPTQKDIPEIQSDSGESALVWNLPDGEMRVRTEQPGEDFTAYSEYCFSKAGVLTRIKFELRTAWGWGYREEGPIKDGVLVPATSQFFDTKIEGPMPRPQQADDIPDALKPQLYLRRSQLPFADLLPR